MGADRLLEGARTEQRATVRRRAAIQCTVTDGEVERYTRLADLSVGGARVVTATPPAVGQSLRMRIVLPDATVEADAVVVWRSEGFHGRGGLMGVQFTLISGVEAIVAYLNGTAAG